MFRVMGNCNKMVTHDEKMELLEDLSDRLRLSGYPPRVAGKIMLNGLKCSFSKVDKAAKSQVMFHRQEGDGRFERKMGKLAARSTWFKPGAGKKDHGKEGELLGKQGTSGNRSSTWASGGGGGDMSGMDRAQRDVRAISKRTEKDIMVTAPLFVQSSQNGKLAALLKEEEETMGRIDHSVR